VFIDAIADLRRRGVAVEADIVGDVYAGEVRFRTALLDQVRESGLESVVSFHGFTPGASDLIAAADVVVVPSVRPEPFGLVVVEAMALGRVVIATAHGGPAEVITDGSDGILVKPGSATAVADAVARLLETPGEAAAIGDRARRRAATFTPAMMTRVVLEVWDDATRANRSPAATRPGWAS
jgi:glycosyltransferase involved in cell wall biosynthesis